MTKTKPSKIKTRNAILNALKQNGPQTAPALATGLGLTAMAVRLHLYDLNEEGLLDYLEEKSGRGRPSKYWRLTAQSRKIFPDAHQNLCVDLINVISDTMGPEGLKRIVATHSQNQCAEYKAKIGCDTSIEDKIQKLAEIRTQEGYMASVDSLTTPTNTEKKSWRLSENHCPICSAASSCTQLCANELWVFASVLGPDVEIEREEHILSGARRCAYKITQKT